MFILFDEMKTSAELLRMILSRKNVDDTTGVLDNLELFPLQIRNYTGGSNNTTDIPYTKILRTN